MPSIVISIANTEDKGSGSFLSPSVRRTARHGKSETVCSEWTHIALMRATRHAPPPTSAQCRVTRLAQQTHSDRELDWLTNGGTTACLRVRLTEMTSASRAETERSVGLELILVLGILSGLVGEVLGDVLAGLVGLGLLHLGDLGALAVAAGGHLGGLSGGQLDVVGDEDVVEHGAGLDLPDLEADKRVGLVLADGGVGLRWWET